MNKEMLLHSETARALYGSVKDLPIYDYHCHLSPEEIARDEVFGNIGDMWLSHDHYKWRLMRAAGIPEELITGGAGDYEKFAAYAKAIELAAGNPLYHWTQMELSRYFGIEKTLSPRTAREIWEEANDIIKKEKLSPRKMTERSRVKYIATTDDPADTLEYHKMLGNDAALTCRITPSFRTDRALGMTDVKYPEYISRLSQAADTEIRTLADLKYALAKRLAYFKEAGCRFSDVGIQVFPGSAASDAQAGAVFQKALGGAGVTQEEYEGFLGNMYVFLAEEYRANDIVMQWHTSVLRNVNTRLFGLCGADAGGDAVNDALSVNNILHMLDLINSNGGLPETVIYSLNPSELTALCAACGSFRNVKCGAAWWFCDHKRGIRDVLETVAETGYIAGFPGMLTDSRSFMSYVRHDYFRRILCGLLAEWVESGELCEDAAYTIARRLSHDNTKKLTEGEKD